MLPAGDWEKLATNIIDDIAQQLNLDNNQKQKLLIELGFEFTDDGLTTVETMTAKIKEALQNVDGFDGNINLNYTDLKTAYKIIQQDGAESIKSLDDLYNKIKEFNYATAPMVNPLDFSNMTNGLDAAADGIDNIANAMSKLQNGTSLTKQELAKLALEYPKLLEASNLFTDGSIEGQKNMLNTVLDMAEQEYDAQIDKKIAELEATEKVLQDQLDLEAEKAQLIQDIKNLEVNGVVGQEADLVAKISELNNLQGKNYVSMENGILRVNQAALNDNLEQQGEFGGEAAEKIWQPFAKVIKTAHTEGFSAAIQAANDYGAKLANWAKNISSGVLQGLGNAVKDIMSGEFKGITAYFSEIGTNISAGEVTVTFDGGEAFVDDKTLEAWVSEQEEASNLRIEKTKELMRKALTSKNNLINFKGLKLPDIYGNDNGKGSGSNKNTKDKQKETDEYLAEVERYAEALQRLRDIEKECEQLERDIENSDSALEKVDLQKRLNHFYTEQQDALHSLNNLRDNTIRDAIPILEELGFQIEYNDEVNRLYIANLEHLNELQAESAGEYETVQEATNALRKETEELIDDITGLNEESQKGSETWLDLADSISEGKKAIIDFLNEIVTQAVDFVDSIQSIYDTLQKAADEYAEAGSISIDSLKAIAEYGVEYMNYLKDENGMLVINKERINAVVAARTQQLAVDTALSYVEKLRLALAENNIEEVNRLVSATDKASSSTWGLVYANLALLDLDDNQYRAALDNINKLKDLADSAIKGIGKDGGNSLSSANDSMESLIDLVMELIKYETEEHIEALEDQIDRYKKIIDLKKESLNATKEENDYNKEVASKVSEIAKLQSRINQLSLDDSREAQAEKKSLEEELAQLQGDLADYQADYSLDKQKESLDNMSEAYEEEKNKEIETARDSISSTEKLYRLAVERITDAWKNDWDGLFQDIIAWNYDAGSSIESEIVEKWNKATDALKTYGLTLDTLNGKMPGSGSDDDAEHTIVSPSNKHGDIKPIIETMKHNSLEWYTADDDRRRELETLNKGYAAKLTEMGFETESGGDGLWYHDGEPIYTITDADKEKYTSSLFDEMRQNKENWWYASPDGQRSLEQRNEELAYRIGEITGKQVSKDEDGYWRLDGELFPIYHNGGVVGGRTNLKDDEVFALLQRGETILNEQQKNAVYEYIDFSKYMMEKFGAGFDAFHKNSFLPHPLMKAIESPGGTRGELPDFTDRNVSYVVESLEVHAPVEVTEKLDKEEIRKHAQTIGAISADYIEEGFTKRGVKSTTKRF